MLQALINLLDLIVGQPDAILVLPLVLSNSALVQYFGIHFVLLLEDLLCFAGLVHQVGIFANQSLYLVL